MIFQNPISDVTSHLIFMVFRFFLTKTLTQFLLLKTFRFWRLLVFNSIFLIRGLSDIFHMMTLGLWVLRGRPQGITVIFITSYQGYILSTWVITLDVVLGHLAWHDYKVFPPWTYSSPCPVHIVYLRKTSLCIVNC